MTQLQTIKIYTDIELSQIKKFAKLGFDMAYIAGELGISFTRFWMDYNNPALDVRHAYDSGIKKAVQINRKNVIKKAKTDSSAQTAMKWELESTRLRNKINEIRAMRENLDL